jgi:hypothetical protein
MYVWISEGGNYSRLCSSPPPSFIDGDMDDLRIWAARSRR